MKRLYKLIDYGLRQGGMLSLFLFIFYTNEIVNKFFFQVGFKLGLSRVNILGYANEVILFANDPHESYIVYMDFKQFIRIFKLKTNETKSNVPFL